MYTLPPLWLEVGCKEIHTETGVFSELFFPFVLLLVSNFNTYRYIFFFKFFSSISCSVAQSCPILCDPLNSSWTASHQVPLSMEFFRQECWSGLPFPSPENLPIPGIKPMSLASPALASRFFITSITWEVTSS